MRSSPEPSTATVGPPASRQPRWAAESTPRARPLDDDDAALGELGGEPAGDLERVRGGRARPDDRDRRPAEDRRRPPRPQAPAADRRCSRAAPDSAGRTSAMASIPSPRGRRERGGGGRTRRVGETVLAVGLARRACSSRHAREACGSCCRSSLKAADARVREKPEHRDGDGGLKVHGTSTCFAAARRVHGTHPVAAAKIERAGTAAATQRSGPTPLS